MKNPLRQTIIALALACLPFAAMAANGQAQELHQGGRQARDSSHQAGHDHGQSGVSAGVTTASSAMAELKPTQGNVTAGSIKFENEGDKVRISGEVSGLKAESSHGFHVHEKGDCSAPDGSSAGGHFGLVGQEHGSPNEAGSHVGDLGNIRTDEDGVARVDIVVPRSKLTLGEGEKDVIGRGLIVHAKADDLVSQPTGNAGDRLACGVIRADR
ncbi:MAG: superoxide dismutase family protein [Lautropia sp.]|nr:superoxide dismutase family protein [Lautropia sp.]